MRDRRLICCLSAWLCLIGTLYAQQAPSPGSIESARAALWRIIGPKANTLRLGGLPATNGCDTFEYQGSGGNVTVRGSSGVAICRGFYEYLRSHHLGMVSWAGKRLSLPANWPDSKLTRVTTPFEKRFYLNVVTYGYTMPFWDWARWEKEIDWMAVHGINMPLALVGTEAIGTRVWKHLGLTQSEIDEFYTGPAYLPWQRMGNITKHEGPLSHSWHADQVALQHKILRRMRDLGMTPITPGFAGFVPKAINRLYPDIKLSQTSWGGFPKDKQAHILQPDHPLFLKVGKMVLAEWQKEFGTSNYWLVDSFNEMDLPKSTVSQSELLARYGQATYESLKAGNPNATWVIQGWMLGYGRETWDNGNFKALLSRVPNDKMLVLDEACDYNANFWHTDMNWKHFEAFYGKPWVYATIPNMGGKTGYTGVLEFYAHHIFEVEGDKARGRLVGYGTDPEGIENNEILYELITDNAWLTKGPNLKVWISDYAKSRYGGCPPAMEEAWDLLRLSCYGTFTDHPHYGWQHGDSTSPGTMNQDPKVAQGVRKFLDCAPELSGSPLYQADALEQAAMVLGAKAGDWFQIGYQAHLKHNGDLRDKAAARGLELLLAVDRLLESHPTHRLQRWVEFASSHGTDAAEKAKYASDARRIVTLWGPPINDYSCRIWSGLIRDYYAPRMKMVFEQLRTGKNISIPAWEESWVRKSSVSKIEPYANPVAEAKKLVEAACNETLPEVH